MTEEHPSFDPKDVGTIIRSRKTSQYFTGAGWSPDCTQAQPFPDEEAAMRACVTHQLQEVDLVMWSPGKGLAAPQESWSGRPGT